MGYDKATTLLEGMAMCEIGGSTTTHTAIWDSLTFDKIIFFMAELHIDAYNTYNYIIHASISVFWDCVRRRPTNQSSTFEKHHPYLDIPILSIDIPRLTIDFPTLTTYQRCSFTISPSAFGDRSVGPRAGP